jgi:hypothetical protein
MAVLGKVTGLSRHYRGGVELLEIHVNKAVASELPAVEGQRVSITLSISGRRYHAGLRSTARCKYVWICPDLTDDSGDKPAKLAYVLAAAGLGKNHQVKLDVSGRHVTLSAASELPQQRAEVGHLGQDVDDAVLGALEKTQAASQGFLLDSKLRKALEEYAMEAAKGYFESLGYTCDDHHETKPYDLQCRRRQEVLHIEVKGTQTDGSAIILTPSEVEFARSHKGQMALYVLHSIQVSEGGDGFVLSKGQRNLILPWDVDLGTLKPMSFKYEVPNRDGG